MTTARIVLLLLVATLGASAVPESVAGPIPARLPVPGQTFWVLCYHDVRYDVRGDIDDDQTAVDARQIISHFEWIKRNGWTVIDIDDVLAARRGERPLPEKSVMLTFDDGYASTYDIVFPLLKLYGFPAVVAVVTSWMETPADEPVRYGDELRPRENFLTWEEVREMQASGLVEIASHSHDLQRGVPGNPQGNIQPAGTTFRYDAASGTYEDEAGYLARVRSDLARSVTLIRENTGVAPRTMVWTYGAHSRLLVEMAADLGMPVTMTTEGRLASLQQVDEMPRELLIANPPLGEIVWLFRNPRRGDPVRAAQVDLDYIYDPDPAQQERNLGRLLDRIKDMRVNRVYLQAFADPDADGVAQSVYFPNRHLPMRADLFNRAAWQLQTRAGVEVQAWMPVLAFAPPGAPDEWYVHTTVDGTPRPAGWRRLSPFHPRARQVILDLYADLARHAHFAGLHFHDDAFLTDFEDASPAALSMLDSRGLPPSVEAIRADDGLLTRWTRIKTDALTALTEQIVDTVGRYNGEIETSRNLFARPLLDPGAQRWYAQSLDAFLDSYDYVTVMAYPYMEGADDPQAWLRRLAARLPDDPAQRSRVVVQLQTRDWRTGEPVPAEVLERQIRMLQASGVTAFAWYPDDFHSDHPPLALVKRTLSLRANPWQP